MATFFKEKETESGLSGNISSNRIACLFIQSNDIPIEWDFTTAISLRSDIKTAISYYRPSNQKVVTTQDSEKHVWAYLGRWIFS